MILSRLKRWSQILTLVCVAGFQSHSEAASVAVPSRSAQAPQSSSPNFSPDLGNRIQAYFIQSRSELGNLEPWQLRLFNEEAVPEYQRFVRGYRLSNASTGLSADIDYENLKNFLRFYAPKSLKREKPNLLVVLRPQANCSKCIASLPEIKTLVGTRLDRRGFKISWVSASELGNSNLSGDDLVSAASQLASQKNAVGTLVVYWQNSVEDEDSSHPDARHYRIYSTLDIRDFSRTQEQLDLTENGSFERSEGKLLADAFTELGSKMSRLEVTQSELNREETLIDVVGIRSFSQYLALKTALQGVIKTGSIEEQKISRGHAVFAVFSQAPIQKIQQMVASAKADGLTLGAPSVAQGVDGNEIHLEVTTAAKAQGAAAPKEGEDSASKGDPEA
jgi:hypothetical protein